MGIKLYPKLKAILVWSLPLLALPAVAPLQAQDIHYTQFYNAPFQISPGLTGIYKGDVRLMTNFRNQWASVPVDYRTFTVATDIRLPWGASENGFWAAGLNINYDRAGYSRLHNANVNLTASYTRRLGKYVYTSLGAQVGGAQRAFRIDDLTFNNQYDPSLSQYNATFDNGEPIGDEQKWYMDMGVGFNLRFQDQDTYELLDKLERRTKIDIGVGIFHLNRADQSFFGVERVPLPMRISPYVSGTVKLTKDLDFVGTWLGQFQGSYMEILYSLAGRLHLDRTPGNQWALQLGANHRFHDFGESYSPALEVHFNTLRVGFSYEVNVSPFRVATERRSGPEISIRYLIRKVPKLPVYKICPLI